MNIRRMPLFWYSVRQVRLKFEQRCKGRRDVEGGNGIETHLSKKVNVVQAPGAKIRSYIQLRNILLIIWCISSPSWVDIFVIRPALVLLQYSSWFLSLGLAQILKYFAYVDDATASPHRRKPSLR